MTVRVVGVGVRVRFFSGILYMDREGETFGNRI
jgi:hypothetical protein